VALEGAIWDRTTHGCFIHTHIFKFNHNSESNHFYTGKTLLFNLKDVSLLVQRVTLFTLCFANVGVVCLENITTRQTGLVS